MSCERSQRNALKAVYANKINHIFLSEFVTEGFFSGRRYIFDGQYLKSFSYYYNIWLAVAKGDWLRCVALCCDGMVPTILYECECEWTRYASFAILRLIIILILVVLMFRHFTVDAIAYRWTSIVYTQLSQQSKVKMTKPSIL